MKEMRTNATGLQWYRIGLCGAAVNFLPPLRAYRRDQKAFESSDVVRLTIAPRCRQLAVPLNQPRRGHFFVLPSCAPGRCVPPDNSRWSHAFANSQSRLTVRSEIPMAAAVSASLKPPK